MDNRFKFFASMIFSKKVISVVFGKQKFKTPEITEDSYIPKTHQFKLSTSYLKEWNEMLDTGGTSKIIPYSYYWPWMMDYTMKNLLPDLGICLKNVLHLGHEATIMEDFSCIQQRNNKLKNSLVDLCPLSKNKIVLVTETSISDENNKTLYSARDFTVVLNMKPEDIDLLKESPLWDHADVPFRDDSFRKKESVFRDAGDDVKKIAYYCESNLASLFGSVAGALSVTHASVLTATFFRKGKVFLQGMCTSNIVLKILCDELGEDIRHFSVYFTNQLAFPQRIEIRCDDSRFEVFDEANTMVAYGQRKHQGTAKTGYTYKNVA